LFPKQAEFVNSEIDDLLYGGAAGGAKSTSIMIFAALRRMAHPGSNGIIFRRTYPQLEKSLILKSRELYPKFNAIYNESKKVWKFPNGALQHFGYCERDADVYNFHSDEYHDMCFDEASLMTEFQITYLTSRCRSTLPNCKPLIRLASNPGNVGHLFLKKRYIEPSKISKTWTDDRTGKTMGFISAKIADNPAILELDPGYIKRLRELGEQKYLALAEGSWDVFEGAYFDFDMRLGVLPYKRVPDTDTFKFLSLDWGYGEPACVLWWEVMPSGRIYVYRELYCPKLSNNELGQRILDMSPSNEKYEYIACDPSIWGKTSEFKDGAESVQQQIQNVLGQRINMIASNNNRIAGWTKLNEYFQLAGDGRPWIQISPLCENLIRTLPTMMHDEKNPSDVSKLGEDHACDSLRYGIMSMQNVPRGQENLSPYERLFGGKSVAENISYLPIPGRGGY
jgi:phage terminase large subunit